MSTTHAHLAVSGNIVNGIDRSRWLTQRDWIGTFKTAGFLLCTQGAIAIVFSGTGGNEPSVNVGLGVLAIIFGIFYYAVGHSPAQRLADAEDCRTSHLC